MPCYPIAFSVITEIQLFFTFQICHILDVWESTPANRVNLSKSDRSYFSCAQVMPICVFADGNNLLSSLFITRRNVWRMTTSDCQFAATIEGRGECRFALTTKISAISGISFRPCPHRNAVFPKQSVFLCRNGIFFRKGFIHRETQKNDLNAERTSTWMALERYLLKIHVKQERQGREALNWKKK